MEVLEGLAERWRDVGERLSIPKASLEIIASDGDSDLERLRGVIRYWLMRDPYASWRRLIWRFHWSLYKDFRQLANSIIKYAEKLTGTATCGERVGTEDVCTCVSVTKHSNTSSSL